jgi:pimeloyl-ACP methyl ester carboxylesterase
MNGKHRSWSANGLTIEGLEWGDEGPIALLHHANGMCAATWQLVAEQLADTYHVFAIDARGHGDSSAPAELTAYTWNNFCSDLAQVAKAILRQTGKRSIALGAGSSFGGITTCLTAARNPDLFDQVIMLDPPLHPDDATRERLSIEPSVQTQREGIVEQTLKRQAVWPDRQTAGSKWRTRPAFVNWTDEAFELYLQHALKDDGNQVVLKCRPEVEATVFSITPGLPFLELTQSLKTPVVLVHAREGFFPRALFEAIAREMPDTDFCDLEGGHMLPMESPDQVAALLRAGRLAASS